MLEFGEEGLAEGVSRSNGDEQLPLQTLGKGEQRRLGDSRSETRSFSGEEPWGFEVRVSTRSWNERGGFLPGGVNAEDWVQRHTL